MKWMGEGEVESGVHWLAASAPFGGGDVVAVDDYIGHFVGVLGVGLCWRTEENGPHCAALDTLDQKRGCERMAQVLLTACGDASNFMSFYPTL
jgi:hypothetical protein